MIQGRVAAEGTLDEVARLPRGDRRLSRARRRMSAPATLEVTDLSAGYVPGVDILSHLSIAAAENAVTLIIGPNGAGKSTLLRAIFGLLKPSAGRVVFDGKDVTGANPSTLKAAGVSYVTQDINSFPLLTVEENLLMGAWVFRRDRAAHRPPVRAGLHDVPDPEGEAPRPRRLALGRPGPHALRRPRADDLALAAADRRADRRPRAQPRRAGLRAFSPPRASATGAAILLVEQNVEEALPLADHLYLLNLGQVKAQGPGREFDNARVRALVQECLLG